MLILFCTYSRDYTMLDPIKLLDNIDWNFKTVKRWQKYR